LRTIGRLSAPQLTEREREVLELLAEGLSNRVVGERLGIFRTHR
jgi:DNA-binding NarL/FixJ family response regulator